MPLSKTISLSDFEDAAVAARARELKAFAWRLFWRSDPFAVNGVLKRRWRIRWNKLWEYSRGLAHVPWEKDWRVLDFGGGATLPVYFLADRGLEVSSFDIDEKLTAAAQTLAARRSWPLHASTRDLTFEPMDAAREYDWVISFCVLEHLPRERQLAVATRLAGYLKPGGFMALTFDFSPDAPVTGAYRTLEEVQDLIAATGLQTMDGAPFHDTGERFSLDRKFPRARFTFGSLFLRKA